MLLCNASFDTVRGSIISCLQNLYIKDSFKMNFSRDNNPTGTTSKKKKCILRFIFPHIRLSGKFEQMISKCISGTFGFCHYIEGGLLLRYTNFGPIRWFISFVRKNNVLWTMCLHFSKMLNIEHRAAIKFFTWKGLNTTEISKELDNVYKDSALSYRTVAKWMAEFKDPECAFEDAP